MISLLVENNYKVFTNYRAYNKFLTGNIQSIDSSVFQEFLFFLCRAHITFSYAGKKKKWKQIFESSKDQQYAKAFQRGHFVRYVPLPCAKYVCKDCVPKISFSI